MNPEEVKKLLGLSPLPGEGGWFRETWRSGLAAGPLDPSANSTPSKVRFADQPHQAGTAIYYFLGPQDKSRLHRIPGDEIYHHYAGGPVNLLLLGTGGAKLFQLGTQWELGQRPQILVPGGTWQGSWVAGEPGWALLGTTVVPGFEFSEWEAGDRTELATQFSQFAKEIAHLCE